MTVTQVYWEILEHLDEIVKNNKQNSEDGPAVIRELARTNREEKRESAEKQNDSYLYQR